LAEDAAQRYLFGDGSLDDWTLAEDAYGALLGLSALVGIAVFVLLIVWTRKAHKVSQLEVREGRRWSQGWSIGAWFIPFANFIITPMMLGEISRIGEARKRTGRGSNWVNGSIPPSIFRDQILIWWWVLYVAGVFLSQISLGVANSAAELYDGWWSTYSVAMQASAVGFVLTAVGASFAAVFVRRTTEKMHWISPPA
jgi:hypothetical protein